MELALVLLVLVLPDLALRWFPRARARLALRPMRLVRRFALPPPAHGPENVRGYRDSPQSRARMALPALPDRMDVAVGTVLLRAGERSFVLVGGWDPDTYEGGFVVRIDASEEKGEIVLRARQALPLAVLPCTSPIVTAWLLASDAPGVTVAIPIAALILWVLVLVAWTRDTHRRDFFTRQAMEDIEHEARALTPRS